MGRRGKSGEKKTNGTQSKPWFNGDLPGFFSLFTLVNHHEKPMVESLGILLVFDAWNFQANPSPEKKIRSWNLQGHVFRENLSPMVGVHEISYVLGWSLLRC